MNNDRLMIWLMKNYQPKTYAYYMVLQALVKQKFIVGLLMIILKKERKFYTFYLR